MGKVTGEICNFCFPNVCKIELRVFREAATFIRVDGEMRPLPAHFDNPVEFMSLGIFKRVSSRSLITHVLNLCK